jgi:hypothetical protein
MEDDTGVGDSGQEGDFSFHHQVLFSESWVSQIYEIVRLLKDRKLVTDSKEFDTLAHNLRLLRIPMDKHEIPGDRKLKAPLMMKRYPPKYETDDVYQYSKDDPIRTHIMPAGISKRGSVVWQVLDITTSESFWIERRWLSERVLSIFGVGEK